MKNKIILPLLVILSIFTLSACGAKKEIVGSWHLTELAGQSLSDYAQSIGLNEILLASTYTINEDGTFQAESGLSLAMGQDELSGTWKYDHGIYVLTLSDGTQYQAELKDGNLNVTASDGLMILAPQAADIDIEKAKQAYEELMGNAGSENNTPEETKEPADETASPDAIEESEKPEEETPAPDDKFAADLPTIYSNMIGKIWKDTEGNYYEFYDDRTCYVEYKNGTELTGEYQFIADGEDLVLDLILNESELIYSLKTMGSDSASFEDVDGNEFELTHTEG